MNNEPENEMEEQLTGDAFWYLFLVLVIIVALIVCGCSTNPTNVKVISIPLASGGYDFITMTNHP